MYIACRVIGWMAGDLNPRSENIFLYSAAFRLALGTTQPPVQSIPGALSLLVK
jgi:hypothetical protein